ncbi:hypothetical protein [Bordetella petrii]|uniref:hypothetical protein n=1 Tax=Bordetella petrii TaxID=94624 RepID=UPI00372E3DE9
MKHAAYLSLLITVLALGGCAATGVQGEQGQLDQFKQGETTWLDVITAVGKSTTQMRNSDDTTALLYTYAEYRTRPETFTRLWGHSSTGRTPIPVM